MTRWLRSRGPGRRALAARLLAATLALGAGTGLSLTLTATPAFAQNEPPADPAAEGAGSGRALDGYFATGCLAGLAMFIIAKSSRRQVVRS